MCARIRGGACMRGGDHIGVPCEIVWLFCVAGLGVVVVVVAVAVAVIAAAVSVVVILVLVAILAVFVVAGCATVLPLL